MTDPIPPTTADPTEGGAGVVDLIPAIEPPPADPTPTDAGVQPVIVEQVAPLQVFRVTAKFDAYNPGDPFPGTDPRVAALIAAGLIA